MTLKIRILPFFGGSVDNFGGRYGKKLRFILDLVINIVSKFGSPTWNSNFELNLSM